MVRFFINLWGITSQAKLISHNSTFDKPINPPVSSYIIINVQLLEEKFYFHKFIYEGRINSWKFKKDEERSEFRRSASMDSSVKLT